MRVLIVLLLVGCTTNRTIYSSDGAEAELITCGAGIFGQGMCFDKAKEMCPNGYQLLDKTTPQYDGDGHTITVRCN